uniref:Uncharacterized protein n=1 Tax=Arundo donax TaxID=35708 RepID=A0A0A9HUV7_ARUDO
MKMNRSSYSREGGPQHDTRPDRYP